MILIKHYANRKLYNTSARQYITLDEIAALVRAGEEIQVTDNETGEDQTALTLAQILLEQEKKKRRGLPSLLLSQLIRAGGDVSNPSQPDLMSSLGDHFFSEETIIRCLEKMEIPTQEDISRLNQQLDNLEANIEAVRSISKGSK